MERHRNSKRSRVVLVLSILFLALPAAFTGDPPQEEEGNSDKVLLYPIRGVLDDALAGRIRDEIEDWRQKEPRIRTILLEIDSPGTAKGRLAPALETARYISELRGVRVSARVLQDRWAGNASALIALAARDLVLSPGAQIGFRPNQGDEDLEVPDGEPKTAEEARKVFQEFALSRAGPIGKSHLAAAMISGHHAPLSQARFDRQVGGGVEEEIRFLTVDEIDNLEPAERMRKKADFVLVPPGKRLTIDQKKVREYGFGIGVETDEYHDALVALRITAGDENIINHETGGTVKPNPPSVQGLIDFLNHPVVRFLLLLAGTVAFLVELKLPGVGIAALVSLACFGIFLVAGLFQPTGGAVTTSLWEILLFLIGMGFIAIELLLLPGVLIFGLSGAAACLIGIVQSMVPPSGSTLDYKHAIMTLIASSATSVFAFLGVLRILPKTGLFDRSGIINYSSIQGTPTADTAIEAQTRAATLVGKSGIALTHLRPAGTIEVDGLRIDVVAEGDFIEKGEKIQIMEIDGTRTLVRKV